MGPGGAAGRQLLVSPEYLNAKSENIVCAYNYKYDRDVVKFIGSNS